MQRLDRAGFGVLLLRYRREAGLSQAELAQRAGLSTRGISDLERGVRRSPYPDTARRLADALALEGAPREHLLGARDGGSAAEPVSPMRAASSSQLPPELTSFVGRSVELDGIADRLATSPLVTITGPGGAGKTRLALQLARRSATLEAYRDGIFPVELAPVGDGRFVGVAVARSLGLRAPTGPGVLDVLVRAFRPRRGLLLLDNCEHVLPACAELVSRVLLACPTMRVLTTSREPLNVRGEVVFRIPPLALPADDRLETLRASEAVGLFVQRGQAARADFVLDQVSARPVADICRRLDGLPLAIELAAARVAAFAPAEIANRLDDAMSIVAGGPRGAPSRQQTLEAAMAWSYDLLADDERSLFQRLAVFFGGFSLDGALAVSQPSGAHLDVLARLVGRSMVQLEPRPDGVVRYRLLEPLRQFAHARLVESGQLEAVRAAHARYILVLAESTQGADGGPGSVGATELLAPEADNIRVALDWFLAAEETNSAIRMGAALWVWWSRPDRQAFGRARLEQLLALPGARRNPALHGQLVTGLAFLSMLQGDMAAAVSIADEAEAIARRFDNQGLLAIVLRVRGTALAFLGDVDGAERMLIEAIDVAGGSGSLWMEIQGLAMLGQLALARGDRQRADALVRQALSAARGGDDPWALGIALNHLGDLLRARGQSNEAGRAYEEALAHFETLDPYRKYIPTGLLHNLGYVALARGDPAQAARLFVESADVYRAVGTDRRGTAECIIGLACTAVAAGEVGLAARLFGSADAELERLGTLLTPANRAEYERGLQVLHKRVGQMPLASGLQEGRELSIDDALDEARPLTRLAPTHRSVGAPGLTRRELEVARLLARGLSNRQIADTLVIGEKTAKNHVHQVLDKLDLHSRSELAARAADLGLRE